MNIPDSIFQKIDNVEIIEDPIELKGLIEEIISELKSIPNYEKDPDINFYIGYCYYFHPDRRYSIEIENIVEQSLQLAISQSPDFAYAWLYLGHNVYDLGNYNLALERFMNVNTDKLNSYIGLKTLEMRVCCKIHLKGLSSCLSDLDEFVTIAEHGESIDLVPWQLAKAITDKAEHLSKYESARFKRFAQRIDTKGGFISNWFLGIWEDIQRLNDVKNE